MASKVPHHVYHDGMRIRCRRTDRARLCRMCDEGIPFVRRDTPRGRGPILVPSRLCWRCRRPMGLDPNMRDKKTRLLSLSWLHCRYCNLTVHQKVKRLVEVPTCGVPTI